MAAAGTHAEIVVADWRMSIDDRQTPRTFSIADGRMAIAVARPDQQFALPRRYSIANPHAPILEGRDSNPPNQLHYDLRALRGDAKRWP